jgi:hypothetical protein
LFSGYFLYSALLKRYVAAADLVTARKLMRRIYPALASFLRKLDLPGG